MVRSILLRGFDQDMAEKIKKHMTSHGMRFLNNSSPVGFAKKDGKIVATYEDLITKEKHEDVYDTVLLAIGRYAITGGLNLDKIGVNLDKKTKKVIVSDNEQSSVENIFSIGDCAEGRPELTPPAIMVCYNKIINIRLENYLREDYTENQS
jgi:pyruvate/2-oxoglutarate dehydrogenase complex dihydrolipoamide dehydrogenase (E3) component